MEATKVVGAYLWSLLLPSMANLSGQIMDTLDKSHPRNARASWTVTLLGPGVETQPTAYIRDHVDT